MQGTRRHGAGLWAQAEQALGARGVRRRACVGLAGGRCRKLSARALGAAGAWACGAGSSMRGRGVRQAGRGALGEHDRQAQGARDLGARAGFGLCTRPVFGPVRLGIFHESNFWTLFVNPVHEHCSSQNFPKKKIFIKLNKNKIK